ncbi:MAG: hypothetical protein ACI9JN_000401 [Bacteroidia bacterium]|jgi:hypothetical protein
MKAFITTAVLLTLLSQFSFAQKAEIVGSVVSQDSLKPMEGLDVLIYRGTEIVGGATTNAAGSFQITDIYPGSYDLKILRYDEIVYSNEIGLGAGEVLTLYNLEVHELGRWLTLTEVGKPRGAEPIKKIKLGEGDPYGSEATTITKTEPNVTMRNGQIQVGVERVGGTQVFIENNTGLIGPGPRTFAGLSGIEIIDRGVPARYGNFTGGGIRYQTKEISATPENFYQFQTTSPFNGYHHNLGVLYFSRALSTRTRIRNKDTIRSTIFGFSFQGNYKFQADPGPSAVSPYVLDEQIRQNILINPLVSSEAIGGYVPAATFLQQGDLNKVAARPNSNRHDLGGRLKLSYNPSTNLSFDFINSFDYTNRRLSQGNFVPMNSDENPIQKYLFVNSQFKLTHKVKSPVYDSGKLLNPSDLIRRLTYVVDINYQQSNSEVSSNRHGANYFNYGYVGQFQTLQVPTYQYVEDGETKFVDEHGQERTLSHYNEFTGYRDSLVNFTPGAANPTLAQYTSFFYDRLGDDQSVQELISRGGLMNGQNIPLLYSLYANSGTVYANYSKSYQKRMSVSARTNMSLHPHKNRERRHLIEIGMNFQQDFIGSYNLNAANLWQLMPLLVNSHIQNVDRQHPVFTTDENGRFTDTISYPTYVDAEGQKTFDKRLREKLIAINYVDANGNKTNETSRIDVNALSPEMFDLSMFSADELLNNGNPYVSYAGYDYKGNRTSGRKGIQRFFDDRQNRPNDAFAPITAAAWIQDKIVLKTLIIRAGLRFERYDGNQYVLKDRYSIFPTKQAGEVSEMNGNTVSHPNNVNSDYVVYVDDENNPSEIVGYRDGNTWYDADGIQISDPNILANKSNSGRIQPYLVDPENQELSAHSFKKFEAQNLILPRISVSFPLSSQSLFFMSYDKLAQNPTAGQTYLPYSSYYYLQSNLSGVLPNPELKARVKTEYNIGFSQGIGVRAGIKLSASYANVVNDVNQFRLEQAYPYSYTTYSNVDFSTIKRYIAEYDYVNKHVSMQASYALQFADGTGSNANSAASLIQSGQPNLRSLFPLSFDNRHTIKGGISLRFGGDSTSSRHLKYKGPRLGKHRILKNMTVSATMQSISGLPYTSIQRAISEAQSANGVVQRSQTKGNPFGSRMPWTNNLDLNIQREFKWGGKTVGVYLLINNVLNTKLINDVYNYTGSPDDDGYLNSPHGLQAAQSQIDAETFVMLYKIRMDNPAHFGAPRMVNLGAKLNF